MESGWEKRIPWLLTLPLGASSLWIAVNVPRWEAHASPFVDHPAVFFLPLAALGILALLSDQSRRGEDDTPDDPDSGAWRLFTAGCFLFLLGRFLTPVLESLWLYALSPPPPAYTRHYTALQWGVITLIFAASWITFTARRQTWGRLLIGFACLLLLIGAAIIAIPILFRARAVA